MNYEDLRDLGSQTASGAPPDGAELALSGRFTVTRTFCPWFDWRSNRV